MENPKTKIWLIAAAVLLLAGAWFAGVKPLPPPQFDSTDLMLAVFYLLPALATFLVIYKLRGKLFYTKVFLIVSTTLLALAVLFVYLMGPACAPCPPNQQVCPLICTTPFRYYLFMIPFIITAGILLFYVVAFIIYRIYRLCRPKLN